MDVENPRYPGIAVFVLLSRLEVEEAETIAPLFRLTQANSMFTWYSVPQGVPNLSSLIES
jgi:hypothetical protein